MSSAHTRKSNPQGNAVFGRLLPESIREKLQIRPTRSAMDSRFCQQEACREHAPTRGASQVALRVSRRGRGEPLPVLAQPLADGIRPRSSLSLEFSVVIRRTMRTSRRK